MHVTSVYITHEQFIRHQPVMHTLARGEDFHTCVVHVLLHTHVFTKFKSSRIVGLQSCKFLIVVSSRALQKCSRIICQLICSVGRNSAGVMKPYISKMG